MTTCSTSQEASAQAVGWLTTRLDTHERSSILILISQRESKYGLYIPFLAASNKLATQLFQSCLLF